MWGGRYTPKNKRTEESTETEAPSPKTIVTRPKCIDPQTYIDTKSPGLASRVVKYYEEGQRKTRALINPLYTRIGDFPIVNLDKNKYKLKVKMTPTTSNITPSFRPNYMMQSRASIMSGSRMNGNETAVYTNGTHPNAHRNENEPLVSHAAEYETAPTRSVLDALKEISRKRIHCDVSCNFYL